MVIEKCKEVVDNGNKSGALLTDLSRVFDCIDHSLLLAKLYGYVLSQTSLKLIFSYESRTQRTKINNSLNKPSKIDYSVP